VQESENVKNMKMMDNILREKSRVLPIPLANSVYGTFETNSAEEQERRQAIEQRRMQ